MISAEDFTKYLSALRHKAIVMSGLTIILFCVSAAVTTVPGQQYKPELFSGMKWRLIGPHRAGRVTAVTGIPGQPAIYYMGTPGGGVWKTTDGGRVWKPIFDDEHVASIGALAMAPTNAQVIYVGTGEQTEGNGVYKSIDGGSTWENIGLRETHYISSIIVDPKNPDVVLVGAIGDSLPSGSRGIFKTTDGGKTWSNVLFKDDTTGIIDMCADPNNSRIIYASTGSNTRQPAVSVTQIFKSGDGGATWRAVGGAGLPDKNRGRIGIASAPGNDGKRLYAIMNQGFFRSDDAGENWKQITTDPRIVGSWYFSRTFADPQNADVVYVMQTTMYRSTDGGKTFEAYKGAPSGEDQHVLWIAPENSKRMILGSDQGAIVSLDEGKTWTSWFNQPTGQFYHVTTDNSFPYYAYAAQQDSGSVVVPSRSDFGQITYREWFSAGAFESGNIAPDPANPNFIYSIGWYGTVLRMDRRTAQISTVFVPGTKYRYTWETPLVFSPIDSKSLYVGMERLLKTSDGAVTWREISPDLTERIITPEQNKETGKDNGVQRTEQQRGFIQTIAPSAVRAGEIWVGTSNGLVQFTRDDGAAWHDVTPPQLPASSSIILIEASPLNADTAFVVASSRKDLQPYIYRTRDAGKTWQLIVAGLPGAGIARVVREDPARQNLLYAGTENGAFISFDGGDRWQPLQLNLPTTSVRDFAVHGDDLVAATYGRGLWILDDLSPLRQLDAKVAESAVYLFQPENALRIRWDNSQETPLPADTAAGQNPPDGAIIDYYLKTAPQKPITIEIRDTQGNTLRHYSSELPPPDTMPGNAPDYWFAPPEALPAKPGMNRFVWNLRLAHPSTLPYSFYGQPLNYIEYTLPDHAVPGETPRYQPEGAIVLPGNYDVILTVEGKTYHQSLLVNLDPRVQTSQADLKAQFDVAANVSNLMAISYSAYNQAESLRTALIERENRLKENPQASEVSDAAIRLGNELDELQNGTKTAPGFGLVNRNLGLIFQMIESGDIRPVQSALNEAAAACESLKKDISRWNTINAESIGNTNRLLEKYKFASLPIFTPEPLPMCSN